LSVIRQSIEMADLVVGELFPGSVGEITDEWLVEQQITPRPNDLVPPGTPVDLLVKSPTDPDPCEVPPPQE
jgi:hypothetical protein